MSSLKINVKTFMSSFLFLHCHQNGNQKLIQKKNIILYLRKFKIQLLTEMLSTIPKCLFTISPDLHSNTCLHNYHIQMKTNIRTFRLSICYTITIYIQIYVNKLLPGIKQYHIFLFVMIQLIVQLLMIECLSNKTNEKKINH